MIQLSRLCLMCNKRFSFPKKAPTALCWTCTFNSDVLATCIYNKKPLKVEIRKLEQVYNATYWTFYEKELLSPGMVIGYTSPHTHRFFIGIIQNLWSGMKNMIQVVPIKRPGLVENFVLTSHQVKCTDIVCLFKVCQETIRLPSAIE